LEEEKNAAEKYLELEKKKKEIKATLVALKLRECEEALERLTFFIDEKKRELESIDKELESVDSALEKVEKEYKEIEEKIVERSKKFYIFREVERVRRELEVKKEKLNTLIAEIRRIEELISLLSDRKEGEDSLFKELTKRVPYGIYGRVKDLISYDSDVSCAVEVGMGNHLNDIVVENEDIAIKCVKLLKELRLGRATFLPVKVMKVKPLPKLPAISGVVGFLFNLIDFDERIAPAISYVCGDTLVVESIDVVKRIGFGKYRYVTLDGDLVEKSGAVVGGYLKRREEKKELKEYERIKKEKEAQARVLEEEIKRLESELSTLSSIEIGEDKDIEMLDNRRRELERELMELRNRRRELFDRKMYLQSVINKHSIQKARLEAELENIRIEAQEIKELPEKITLTDIYTLENELRRVESEIRALGFVNLKAIEDYERELAVFEEYEKKVETLEKEREKILATIEEIEKRKRDAFFDTLEKLRQSFKRVFRDLTGGDVEIMLENPDDITSGLVITASPHGKKLTNIDLLSGGEKTLTAIAFLFAIQHFKPSPFYILDEIDAALDKANTRKIVEFIKKYSRESQFIVISHNEITISSAECLYGVTMQDGVSTVLSLKLITDKEENN
jgi:chromosome segregation ATPase